MEREIKGITARILWQAFAGWTTMIITLLGVYFSLKSEISNGNLVQSRTDAIQDIRIDAIIKQMIPYFGMGKSTIKFAKSTTQKCQKILNLKEKKSI